MLRKFRIRTRLLLSFFIVVLFTLIVGLTGFISLTSMGKSSVKTIHNVAILNDIYDNNVFIDNGIFNMLYISDSTLTKYVLRTTREHTEQLLNRLNEYVAIQDNFNDVFTPGEMQDMENLLEIYMESYIPLAYEIFDLVEQERMEEALSVYISRLTPVYNTFTYYLNVGFIKNLETSDTRMKENNDKALSNIYLILTLAVMSMAASVLLALAVTKSIAIPLSELGEAAEKVANGQLDIQFEQSQSSDEIAQLSQRLQETLYHLNQVQKLKLEAVEAQAEKEKAEAASKSKDEFLAKMSHEIRTPMNAITGMAELALREDRHEMVREHILTIKQASANLLSIINDILDFSKIESGKLEIVPVSYRLSSLVNDTINIIRMRLMEKPIRFFTNIDGNIPNNLFGDQTRLRQIFLNLLTNAVKYSEKGVIGLTITMEKQNSKQVWIKIAVSDTGKGIKQEDQEKLFDEFVKVDLKNNQGIEGTGLGLAITKRLCAAMEGEISFQSEYGKGSVFTAVVPQIIEADIPFAAVEEPAKKKILVYEGRSVYAGAVCWTLKNLNVPYTLVANQEEFAAALYREEWFYVFSSYGLYDKIKPVIEQNDSAFFKGKKPPMALMVEWGTEAYVPGVRFVSIPIQSLSIANILNGKTDSKDEKNTSLFRFSFPGARLLVVDDIATNLKVVEGLLAPYKTIIDTCTNGFQAIEFVKNAAIRNRDYDIVFMDHMMPGMDGIEATTAIREWENEQNEKIKANSADSETQSSDRYLRRQIPIIALTANAVVGMREMFIEKGFNDFISKPIDVSKLDEILNRWIPEGKRKEEKEKKEEGKEHVIWIKIHGVDTAKGISLTGGTLDAYLQVLALFLKDVKDRLPLFQDVPNANNMSIFITNVHALKSASASLGAVEISTIAAELEAAGKAADMVFINKQLPVFEKQLAELAYNIETVLKTKASESQDVSQDDAPLPAAYYRLFNDLADAIKAKKSADIDKLLEELNRKPLDAKTRETLNKISDEILMTEFDNALKIIEELLR
jgi:signal transduction histidine kinase/DNA-binding response OmpR family regulator